MTVFSFSRTAKFKMDWLQVKKLSVGLLQSEKRAEEREIILFFFFTFFETIIPINLHKVYNLVLFFLETLWLVIVLKVRFCDVT